MTNHNNYEIGIPNAMLNDLINKWLVVYVSYLKDEKLSCTFVFDLKEYVIKWERREKNKICYVGKVWVIPIFLFLCNKDSYWSSTNIEY